MGAAGPVQQPDYVGVESRERGAGPVRVPNSSSLYTLFYSVICISVVHAHPWIVGHEHVNSSVQGSYIFASYWLKKTG